MFIHSFIFHVYSIFDNNRHWESTVNTVCVNSSSGSLVVVKVLYPQKVKTKVNLIFFTPQLGPFKGEQFSFQ